MSEVQAGVPSKRRVSWNQSNITRALKAAVDAGFRVTAAKINQDGTVDLQFGAGSAQGADDDKELAEFRRANGYS